MSKPAAYTVQLQKKANGVLEMKLMVPGHPNITMKPKELRDVAQGIEAMFAEAGQRPAVTRKEKAEASREADVHLQLVPVLIEVCRMDAAIRDARLALLEAKIAELRARK